MAAQEENLSRLKPHDKPNVIDLVAKAGIDVSDWANWKKGANYAGQNSRYCYEWCFEQEGMFVLNIWFENMVFENGNVFQRLNFKKLPADTVGVRRTRAGRFDRAVKAAHETGSHPRVIILDRKTAGAGSATARLLDDAPWTVVKYDPSTGDFEIRRGIVPPETTVAGDPDLEEFQEGEARKRFVTHRKREAKLRQKKIDQHKHRNGGRLICEVPGCAFDFRARYGEIGEGYAQVHHLVPLSDVESESIGNTVDDLAVVCANCHVMIHRGGNCRSMEGLISKAISIV